MFDIVLYPVSAVLWFWHAAFGALMGPDSGVAWALAIVFLVFTVRTMLIRPALGQLRAARRTQALAPRIKKIREKYRGDRQRMAQEIQKLHTETGTSPFGGCLPALLQIPVFLSLYWVLRDFTPGATGNHIFDAAGVRSFLNADLFGAKLGNWVSQPMTELLAFGTDRQRAPPSTRSRPRPAPVPTSCRSAASAAASCRPRSPTSSSPHRRTSRQHP